MLGNGRLEAMCKAALTTSALNPLLTKTKALMVRKDWPIFVARLVVDTSQNRKTCPKLLRGEAPQESLVRYLCTSPTVCWIKAD